MEIIIMTTLPFRGALLAAVLLAAGCSAPGPSEPAPADPGPQPADLRDPGTSKLVFSGTPPGGGGAQLFFASVDGERRVQVSRDRSVAHLAPALSPDGTRIAFERYAAPSSGAPSDLWIMRVDGTGLVQITSTPGYHEHDPRWSPDGRWIAFSRRPHPTGVPEVMVVPAQGGEPRRFVPSQPAGAEELDWSPSGDSVVFTGRDGALYVSAADGSNATMLLHWAPRTAYRAPRWSPDGAQIVFSVHWATAGDAGHGADIITPAGARRGVDLSGRGIPGSSTIGWSPDGRALVVYARGETPAVSGIHFLTSGGDEIRFLPGEYEGVSWWAPSR
jgi:Tol biopolymer transport system component